MNNYDKLINESINRIDNSLNNYIKNSNKIFVSSNISLKYTKTKNEKYIPNTSNSHSSLKA